MALAMLKIQAFSHPSTAKRDGKGKLVKTKASEPFEVQFNPETITVTASKELKKQGAANVNTAQPEFLKKNPKTYQFTLVLDATGATGKKKEDVGEKVAMFMKLAYYPQTGNKSASFLEITWGNFQIYCVLESVNITYKLFDPQGLPIRASLDCSFKEYYAGEEVDASMSDWTGAKSLAETQDSYDLVAAKGYGSPNLVNTEARKLGLDTLRGEGMAIARRQGQLL